MATNPMQRKARNSFLAGMLITLIISVIIVAALVYKIMGLNASLNEITSSKQTIWVLSEEVKSGNKVDPSMFEEIEIASWKKNKMSKLQTGSFLNIRNTTIFDGGDENSEDVNVIAKTDLYPGMPVTEDLLREVGKEITDDTRMEEYNMIELPTELVAGDYVDIRLQLPGGQNYIVVSKKYVEKTNLDTIWMQMNEDEILILGNAIVESYIIEGSKLYAVKYVEGGIQQTSTVTYSPSPEVYNLIMRNPNATDVAKAGLQERYNSQGHVDQRNNVIRPELDKYEEDRNASVSTGVQKEIEKIKASREEYLSTLDEN